MTLIEKIFALKSISPFNRLEYSELILTANITKIKKYNAGDIIQPKELYVYSIFIIIDGEVTNIDTQSKNSKIFGIKEILEDKTFKDDIVAKTPVKIMTISKSHFFTLIYECPNILLELLNLTDKRG